MSTHEQHTPTVPTSAVRNTGGRSGPQRLEEPTPDEVLRELCDKNYHQLLPLIAEKMQKEKEQQDKLNAVKARLLYGNETGKNQRNHEESHYSESKTPTARTEPKRRHENRRSRSPTPVASIRFIPLQGERFWGLWKAGTNGDINRYWAYCRCAPKKLPYVSLARVTFIKSFKTRNTSIKSQQQSTIYDSSSEKYAKLESGVVAITPYGSGLAMLRILIGFMSWLAGWQLVKATELKLCKKAVQISGALTDEAVRNGIIKKVEKRGNVGEPSKARIGRDDIRDQDCECFCLLL
ncbi:hypothetical protein Tco_1524961 [Tanacetum coccineum]